MPANDVPGAFEWVAPPGETLGDDVLSITVVATGAERTRLSIGVMDDGERVLVDANGPERSPNRVLSGRGLIVGMIPSSSSSVAALGWAANVRVNTRAVGVEAPSEVPVSVSVWTKRRLPGSGGAQTAAGRQDLPMTVYLVGDLPQDDVRLAIALGEVGRIWRAAGIEILEPARVRIGGDQGRRFERIEIDPALGNDSPALGQLLQSAVALDPSTTDSPTLALYLVADITTGPGASIWALSGGIPVPPAGGTLRSGIAVNAAIVAIDPVHAGQIIAHEIGHALGLFHTTEGPLIESAAGETPQPIHDQVDDSPECPADADAQPRDGRLGASECERYDAANLMFWTAERGATKVTAGQADIARRSPLAR